VRTLRSGLLLAGLAALTFGAERLASRTAELVWTLAPSLQEWNVGGLWFYSAILAILLLVSAPLPEAVRTRWWPEAWDRWGGVGLGAAALAGPLGYAVFRWEPLHWHAPIAGFNFLSGALLGPLAEEWAFRGVLWDAAERATGRGKWSPIVAGIFTSLLFGLWHIPFQDQPPTLVIATNAAFGACLGLARWRFKAVGPGAIVHALGNAFFLLTS
jgi:membrane protease YdiL (CAAX protease family)